MRWRCRLDRADYQGLFQFFDPTDCQDRSGWYQDWPQWQNRRCLKRLLLRRVSASPPHLITQTDNPNRLRYHLNSGYLSRN